MKFVDKKTNTNVEPRGFSMIETLIALGIFSLLAAAVITFMLSVQVQIQGEKNKSSVYLARNIVARLLKSPAAWDVTVARQKYTAFACFENPQSSCLGTDNQGYTTFALYDATGNLIVAPASSRPGFTYQGSSCIGTDLTNGNDQCPIAAQIKWKRLCPTPACENPVAHVVVDFLHSPRSRSRQQPLNTKTLRVSLDIPKFRRAVVANTVVGYYYPQPKRYDNRTSADTRSWQNPCSVHTKETRGWVDVPAPSTMLANGTAWVLQWGASNHAALLPPAPEYIPASVELEMYVAGGALPCASDSGYVIIQGNAPYDDPNWTNGAQLNVSCSRYFSSPGRYELRLVARVTSCVMNSAIDNNPDFRNMGLEYTLLR